MTRRITGARTAALALSLLGCLAAPLGAQAQSDDGPGFRGAPPPPPPGQPAPQAGPGGPPPKKRHHDGDVGAAIGAGLVGGLVGGALLNGQRQAPPPYQQPAYAPPPPPPPPAYEVEDEPVCRIIRKPVYDEDSEIVSYRTRRVCN